MKYIFFILVFYPLTLFGGNEGGGIGIVNESMFRASLNSISISRLELAEIKDMQSISAKPVFLHTEARVLEVGKTSVGNIETEILNATDIDTNEVVLLIAE